MLTACYYRTQQFHLGKYWRELKTYACIYVLVALLQSTHCLCLAVLLLKLCDPYWISLCIHVFSLLNLRVGYDLIRAWRANHSFYNQRHVTYFILYTPTALYEPCVYRYASFTHVNQRICSSYFQNPKYLDPDVCIT